MNSRPLGYCASQVDSPNIGTREQNLLSLSYGNIVRKDIAGSDGLLPESFETYNVVEPGDTVLRLTDLQNDQRSLRVGFVQERGIITSAYVTLRPQHDVDPRFFSYVLKSMDFRKDFYALGAGVRQSLKFDELKRVQIHLPALKEQRAIADYLDTETARIDSLIDKKQRMVDLLEERLQTALRIRLSNLQAPVLPLKRAWRVMDCKHRTPIYVDDGFPVVSPGDVSPGRLDLSRATRFVSLEDLDDLTEGSRRPRRGDVIYSRNASIGTAAFVDTDDRFCMGQDVCLITSVDHDQLFLTYVLNTVGLDQLDVQKIGSTFSRVNISQIVEILVPVPAPAEQEEVAGELDRMSTQSRLVQAKLRHQITMLGEHRQALITAAVTGELEVSGVAA